MCCFQFIHSMACSTIHRGIAGSLWQLQQCTSCLYCPNQQVVWAWGERPFPGGPAPPKWVAYQQKVLAVTETYKKARLFPCSKKRRRGTGVGMISGVFTPLSTRLIEIALKNNNGCMTSPGNLKWWPKSWTSAVWCRSRGVKEAEAAATKNQPPLVSIFFFPFPLRFCIRIIWLFFPHFSLPLSPFFSLHTIFSIMQGVSFSATSFQPI